MPIRKYKLNIMLTDDETKQLEVLLQEFEMTVSNYIRLILKYSNLSVIQNLSDSIDQFDNLTTGVDRKNNYTIRLSEVEKDVLDNLLNNYDIKASKLVRFLLFAPSKISIKINFSPL